MRRLRNSARPASARKFWLPALVLGLFVLALAGTRPAEANHPVLVEGNCDSPVPGTTIVEPGTCGDFDGDGRIGTAEDTDGADRIFGTINAALGPGTGAAAGTGANFNGRIVIVKSGRFSEAVNPATNTAINIALGSGHVQIEAAPGVDANIDAVFQGDPAGGNNIRQDAIGLSASGPSGATVTLRNLVVRNWAIGMRVGGNVQVLVENCRFDNNRDFGIQMLNSSRLTLNNSQVTATGRRVGTANNATSFGHGVQFADASAGVLSSSVIVNNLGAAIQQNSGLAVVTFHLVTTGNGGGNVTGPGPVVKENF